ncbi:hypothetical protein D3C81_1691650 [compost metagenome]
MDKVRELERVTDEENRGVVTHDVPVAFLGVKLYRKATRITLGVCRTALATYGRKTQEGFSLLTNRVKQLGLGESSDVLGDCKGAIGSGALGVYTPLRDVLAIEVSELLDQVEIVEQQRAAGASRAGILVVSYGGTAGGGENLAHGLSISVSDCRLIGLDRSIDERLFQNKFITCLISIEINNTCRNKKPGTRPGFL